MFDRQAKLALIIACVTLVVSGAGFQVAARALKVYLHKERVDLREHFDNIPTALGQWRAVGEDTKLPAEMVEELGTKTYLDRNWALNGDPRQAMVNLHLAYYTGLIDPVPHIPDRCFIAGGFNARTRPENYQLPLRRDEWMRDLQHVNRSSGEPYQTVLRRDAITGRTNSVRMPVGAFELRTIEFSHADRPGERIFGGYFFIANGRIAPTPEGVKQLAFSKSERYAYYCKVQFVMRDREGLDAERFVSLAGDLLDALLPELMNCLPDWAEVEARTSADEK